jgi:hypothetical protein
VCVCARARARVCVWGCARARARVRACVCVRACARCVCVCTSLLTYFCALRHSPALNRCSTISRRSGARHLRSKRQCFRSCCRTNRASRQLLSCLQFCLFAHYIHFITHARRESRTHARTHACTHARTHARMCALTPLRPYALASHSLFRVSSARKLTRQSATERAYAHTRMRWILPDTSPLPHCVCTLCHPLAHSLIP